MSGTTKKTDSKQPKLPIAETDQFFSILNNFPGIAYLQAQDYSIRFANKKFIELYGDPDGKPCYATIWSREEACTDCRTFKVFDTNEPATWLSSHSDGRTYKVYDHPFLTKENELLVLEMSIDTTEQLNAELELDRLKEKFQGMFRNSMVGLSRTRLSDGKFIEFNNRLVEMLGYTDRIEFEQKHNSKQFYARQGDRDCFLDLLKEKGSVENYTVLVRRKDNTTFWMQLSARIDLENGYVDVVSLDVDRERKAEEKLKASEEKYRTLFEESNDVIFVTSPKGSVLEINQAGLNLFGYTKEEISKLDIATEIYNNPEQREVFKAALIKNGSIKNFEIEFKLKNGKVRSGTLSANVQHNSDGSVYGFRGILHDITERKQLQMQLQHSQKMEAIGRLAGGIAHDFNNIVTVTKTLSDLAMARVGEDSKLIEYLKPISESSDRASNLVQQLLLFSRNKTPNTAKIDLNRTIVELLGMLEHLISEDISITSELSVELLTIEADNARLEQLLTNLVVNASEAMPCGGEINIKTWNTSSTEKECFSLQNEPPGSGHYICLEISDNGAGMDENVLEHIFEPFFTTDKARGTGMGLAVVYGIVTELNGGINVISTPGTGSRFKICIPAIDAPEEKCCKARPVPVSPAGNGKRILLVEDDKWVRKSTEMLLTDFGYEVFEARNAEKALSLFYHEKGKFDLVISDVVMPGRSGIELLDPLLEINPHIPVLLCSGHIDNKEQFEEIIRRRIPYIQKPYANHELLLAIAETIEEKSAVGRKKLEDTET